MTEKNYTSRDLFSKTTQGIKLYSCGSEALSEGHDAELLSLANENYEERISSMHIGQRVKKSEQYPYGWKQIDEINPDQTCVIVLGGDGAKTDRATNAYIRDIQKYILQPMDLDVSIYGVVYDFSENEDTSASRYALFKRYRQNTCGPSRRDEILSKDIHENQLNPKYIEKLYKTLIEPRISRKLGNERLKISQEQASINIRKMNIVAHCHGAFVALKLEEMMQQKMTELGYSKDERNMIQSQMLVIAHSPACPLGCSKSQFISFISARDLNPNDMKVTSSSNLMNNYLRNKMREDMRYTDDILEGKQPTKDNFSLDVSYIPGKQGNAFIAKQKYPYGEEVFMVDEREHGTFLPDADQTKDGNILLGLSTYALINGVENSLQQKDKLVPLESVKELVFPKDIDKKTRDENWEKLISRGKKLRQDVLSDVIIKRKLAENVK